MWNVGVEADMVSKMHHEKLDSTNERAKRHIRESLQSEVFVITANEQKYGKGRNPDTKWLSPLNAGIYMSIGIPYDLAAGMITEDWFITERIGHALKWTLRTLTSLHIEQKGVNDLYLNGRKVGGILCEMYKGYLIVGVGINLYRPKRVVSPLNTTAIWLDEVLNRNLIHKQVYERVIADEIIKLVK